VEKREDNKKEIINKKWVVMAFILAVLIVRN
jgi:hypothetical protein